MYLIRLSILSLIFVAVSGCTYNRGRILDYELYDSGKPKKTHSMNYYEDSFRHYESRYSHSSEYYENGRLKLEEWSEFNRTVLRLEFYDNGQLKSEERYKKGKLEYGAYYKEDGQIKQTTGQLIDWVTHKSS